MSEWAGLASGTSLPRPGPGAHAVQQPTCPLVLTPSSPAADCRLGEDRAWHPVMPEDMAQWSPVQAALSRLILATPLRMWASVAYSFRFTVELDRWASLPASRQPGRSPARPPCSQDAPTTHTHKQSPAPALQVHPAPDAARGRQLGSGGPVCGRCRARRRLPLRLVGPGQVLAHALAGLPLLAE